MKIKYFADTDTLHIEFRSSLVAETRDLDEDTLLDMDADGNICAITVEHASKRTRGVKAERNGVPLLPVRRGATPVTMDLVNQLRDELP
jgi:uncharacterized protein YuzE